MPTENKTRHPKIQLNDSLPTLYVDNVTVYKRQDKVTLLRFTSNLPEGEREQVRLMVDKEDLRSILDVICQVSNHYPKKPGKTKKTSAK